MIDTKLILDLAKFVPKHPVGTEGFFFTPYEVHTFLDELGEVYDMADELYWHLWNNWVQSGDYTYKHKWQEGDILLFDQLITIHKRPIDSFREDMPRELLRSASWYKTRDRIHYGHVV